MMDNILAGKSFDFDYNMLINSHGRMLLFGRDQDAFLELHMNTSSKSLNFSLEDNVGYALITQIYIKYPYMSSCVH